MHIQTEACHVPSVQGLRCASVGARKRFRIYEWFLHPVFSQFLRQDVLHFDNLPVYKYHNGYEYSVQAVSYTHLDVYKRQIYGVPFDIGTEGLFYRKDYIEQAGYTEQDLTDITWDKLIEIGKKVKEVTGKDLMTLDPNTMTIMRDFMQSSGTWYFTPDGDVYKRQL